MTQRLGRMVTLSELSPFVAFFFFSLEHWEKIYLCISSKYAGVKIGLSILS